MKLVTYSSDPMADLVSYNNLGYSVLSATWDTKKINFYNTTTTTWQYVQFIPENDVPICRRAKASACFRTALFGTQWNTGSTRDGYMNGYLMARIDDNNYVMLYWDWSTPSSTNVFNFTLVKVVHGGSDVYLNFNGDEYAVFTPETSTGCTTYKTVSIGYNISEANSTQYYLHPFLKINSLIFPFPYNLYMLINKSSFSNPTLRLALCSACTIPTAMTSIIKGVE